MRREEGGGEEGVRKERCGRRGKGGLVREEGRGRRVKGGGLGMRG